MFFLNIILTFPLVITLNRNSVNDHIVALLTRTIGTFESTLFGNAHPAFANTYPRNISFCHIMNYIYAHTHKIFYD